MKKITRYGFTLAEVLITLVIIGVIAAMTIPTLLQNKEKQETITGLKKVYTTLQNAIKMSEIENGNVTTWTIPGSGALYMPHIAANKAFLDQYIKPYLKVNLDCTESTSSTCKTLTSPNQAIIAKPYYLADGAKIGFALYGSENEALPGTTHGGIIVDINGDKSPNKVGKDIFVLYFSTLTDVIQPFYYSNKIDWRNRNRTDIINCPNPDMRCTASSNKQCCAALIMRDNWEIKDDYPW